ncbi:hypothetical protein TVAG_346150 [Trichomonas vaginalis G3]|uniref:Tubby C-terminal domain-containing protein n=1 Tax=Trichomonas vaginalis (strain ATCC PRA-98 / G3) TaxID=412133 RepID=A2FK05_TRIV3|nr:tubby protein, chain A domain-containing protein [Trichomonas vaginalis G3]EAX94752.1 hypothetical protein TVAG_346150 [Trichomonas vaginalis G3]KAI5492002.1 tubby protein, chain A domain-containing protein [Trichomonas vaginalis G3]|eukprot:XP_001307682.1 hypothetical protein [Trichomonas vaginalis G3]
MSLFNVDFSSSDGDDVNLFKNTVPFKPRFNVPDENGKSKYPQDNNNQRRRVRKNKEATKVEKKVVEVQPQVLESPPQRHVNTRKTRKKDIITFQEVDLSEEHTDPEPTLVEKASDVTTETAPKEIEATRPVKAEKPKNTDEKPRKRSQRRESSPEKFVKIDSSSSENATDEPTDPEEEKDNKKEQEKPKDIPPVKTTPQPNQPIGNHSKYAIPIEVKSKEQPVYRISREKNVGLLGSTFTFRFYMLSEFILSAVYKKGSESIQISKDDTSDVDAYVSVGNKTAAFSLRLKSQTSDEILSIRFYPKEGKDPARRMCVSFFNQAEGIPKKLMSRQPTEKVLKKVTYNFHGRFHVQSVKNAVLYEKKDGDDLFWIRKIQTDVIELQAVFPLEPESMFAIGLAAFITEVK